MRTRRISIADAAPTLQSVAETLAALGYRRRGDAFERAGIFLVERVTLERDALVYRYATSWLRWGLVMVALVAGALALTGVLAPRLITGLASLGLGRHWLLSALVWVLSFFVCYSPFTWVFAALAAPGFARERSTLDHLLRLARPRAP